MQNSVLTIKIKQRLNKLDSNDYDNIECWQIVEAFNKAQVEWSRRQLHGINILKEGDEQSTRRKDDLQVLLNSQSLTKSKLLTISEYGIIPCSLLIELYKSLRYPTPSATVSKVLIGISV